MSKVVEKTLDGTNLDVPIEGIFMKEKRYFLTPLEHRILTDYESSFDEWSKRFLLISIGLTLTVLSKVVIFIYEFGNATVEQKSKIKLNIQDWELIYLCVGFFLIITLFLLSKTKLNKSEKKDLLDSIKNYFDEK